MVKDRSELDLKHGRQEASRAVSVSSGLEKAIESDWIFLDRIITAGSLSQAWKILSGMMDNESNEVAHDKMRKDFKQFTLRVGGGESVRGNLLS